MALFPGFNSGRRVSQSTILAEWARSKQSFQSSKGYRSHCLCSFFVVFHNAEEVEQCDKWFLSATENEGKGLGIRNILLGMYCKSPCQGTKQCICSLADKKKRHQESCGSSLLGQRFNCFWFSELRANHTWSEQHLATKRWKQKKLKQQIYICLSCERTLGGLPLKLIAD